MNDVSDVSTGSHPVRSRARATRLPVQNLLLATAVLGGVSGVALFLNAHTGFPFGRGHLAGEVPAHWIIGCQAGLVLAATLSLLTARGVAKLLLLPLRGRQDYGYWLLGSSALLGTLPLTGLDLLATQVGHWWRWESSAWQWQGIALPTIAGWLLVHSIALLFATPALIDKRPVASAPGVLPLVGWFALNAVCIASCLSHTRDAAVAVLAAPVLLVTTLAFRRSCRVSDRSP